MFKKRLFIVMLLALMCCSIALPVSGMAVSYAAEEVLKPLSEEVSEPQINGNYIDFHGLKLDPDTTLEAYGLKLKLMDHGGQFRNNPTSYKYVTREITLLCVFNDLRYDNNGSSLMFRFFFPAKVETYGNEFYFRENPIISLTNNYYKYFAQQEKSGEIDFSSISISLWRVEGAIDFYKIYQFTGFLNLGPHKTSFVFESELVSYNVPVSVVDPEDDEFELDFGNSGTNTMPEIPEETVKETFEGVLAWFTATLFGDTGSVMQVVLWIVLLLVGILAFGAVVYVLGFLGKALKFLYGK